MAEAVKASLAEGKAAKAKWPKAKANAYATAVMKKAQKSAA